MFQRSQESLLWPMKISNTSTIPIYVSSLRMCNQDGLANHMHLQSYWEMYVFLKIFIPIGIRLSKNLKKKFSTKSTNICLLSSSHWIFSIIKQRQENLKKSSFQDKWDFSGQKIQSEAIFLPLCSCTECIPLLGSKNKRHHSASASSDSNSFFSSTLNLSVTLFKATCFSYYTFSLILMNLIIIRVPPTDTSDLCQIGPLLVTYCKNHIEYFYTAQNY